MQFLKSQYYKELVVKYILEYSKCIQHAEHTFVEMQFTRALRRLLLDPPTGRVLPMLPGALDADAPAAFYQYNTDPRHPPQRL